MKPSFRDQLKDVRIDYKTYGNLPCREDLLYAIMDLPENNSTGIVKQWKKLNYIRKNLNILDKYIHTNTGETLNEWLRAAGQAMKPEIMKTLGKSNDESKGISAYFLNLQQFYDNEEALYDEMENSIPIPKSKDVHPHAEMQLAKMREERAKKRTNRTKVRKMKLDAFEKDNKGYIVIEELDSNAPASDTPTRTFGADSERNQTVEEMGTEDSQTGSWGDSYVPQTDIPQTEQPVAQEKKVVVNLNVVDTVRRQKTMSIVIAGAAIFFTAMVINSLSSKKS